MLVCGWGLPARGLGGWADNNQFFENGTAAFESKQSRSRVSDGYQKKIQALEQKLQRKNEVLSELLEEHTRLKKELGET
jgi:transposase